MDDATFERCLTHYEYPVRAYIAGLGLHPDAVDDVAQETFVDYYFAADQRPPDVNELAWLRGIARHKALDFVRSRSRQRALHERLAHQLEQTSSLFDTNLDEDLLDRLARCLGQLPTAERDLVHRFYAQGESSAAIGARLRRSAAGIRMTLMRLREQLRLCVRTAGGRP